MNYKKEIIYIWNLQWITHLIHLIASTFVEELFANVVLTSQMPKTSSGPKTKFETIFNVCHFHFIPNMAIKFPIHSLYLSYN
jgi:hypothetical protein